MNQLNFYKTHGNRTLVDSKTFNNFPQDVKSLTEIIRGVGMHPCHLNGLILPSERINDRYLKTVQEVVKKIKILDDSDLIKNRNDENKIVIICRHFAMLLTSILREQGVPARCRCGFATYFSNGWFEDHWICEYWNGVRWIRVDPQMDKLITAKKQLNNIDFNDMPSDIFFIGGVLWKLYREGIISGEFCGFSHEESERGEWYIRDNMLRDYFSLNKIEYSYQETNYLMDRNYIPNKEELILLDKIADLTININDNFNEFIQFCKNNKEINIKEKELVLDKVINELKHNRRR